VNTNSAREAQVKTTPLDDEAFLAEQERLSTWANTRHRADLERTCSEDVPRLIAIARKRAMPSGKEIKNHLASKGMPIGLAASAARLVVAFIKSRQ
jgi:hypothetical protein